MTRSRQQSAELKRRIVEEVRAHPERTFASIATAEGVSQRYVAYVAKNARIFHGRWGRPRKPK